MFDSMSHDPALFGLPLRRLIPGRVRKGLEADVRAARERDAPLSYAGIATLRSLADQIDATERQLRAPEARPYDRIPLSALVRQFDDTYGRVFAVLQRDSDPLSRALAEFMAAEQGAEQTGARDDDAGTPA